MAAAPSRSSILFALCLLASGTLLGLDVQGAQAATASALQVPVQHGQGPRLRARSEGHLAEWALKERQRLVGKYGPEPSVNANGLQPLLRRDDDGRNGVDEAGVLQQPRPTGRQLKPRQQSISSGSATSSSSSSASRTTELTGTGSSTVAQEAAATTTGLVGTIPNNRTINPRTGYANLTNYQADLCVRLKPRRWLARARNSLWALRLLVPRADGFTLYRRHALGNTM